MIRKKQARPWRPSGQTKRVFRSPARAVVLAITLAVIGYIALQISNAASEAPQTEPRVPISVVDVAAEQIIVRYKPDADMTSLGGAISETGATEKAGMKSLRMKVLRVPRAARGVIMERLKADPRFELVEADIVGKTDITTPNDTEYSKQWAWPQIVADMLWDKTKASPSITVAVVDSGINMTHPDFAGKLLLGKDFVNNDNDPADDQGHGSAVSGVIGAVTNNNIGIASGCWNCKILPIKTNDSNGNVTLSSAIQGFDFAVASGAKIINFSSGFETPSSTLKTAVDNAVAKGVIVVSTAGNSSKDAAVRIPGSYDNVIGVAATLPDDALASYSNFGATVAIAAPGEAFTTAHNSDGYVTVNGTSFSAPMVTSIIASLWSTFPSATPAQIRNAVTSTADTCCDGKISGGRINAMKAYNALAGTTSDTTAPSSVNILSPAANLSVSGGSVPVTASATDNVAVVKMHLWIDNRLRFNVDSAAPYWWNWNAAGLSDGPHTLTMTAYDAAGNSSRTSRTVMVNNTTPADMAKPSVSFISPAAGTVLSGTAARIEAGAQDNVSVALVRAWVDDETSFVVDLSAPFNYTFDTTRRPDGEHTINLMAIDSTGNSSAAVSRKFTFKNSTTPPAPPPTTPPKPADLNGDGKVTISDLSVLLSNWGKTGTALPSDLNKNGKVDVSDLSILLSNWST